jgi:hypothetical protein
MTPIEQERLADPAWRRYGPYLSERAWGTVREDYSDGGAAWDSFPHDHARSRAYRWSEDGLGGICDDQQYVCLAFAFWNGVDPILKERIFGLTGPEGNHGEDAKEYWWYLDSTPSHSWLRWRYVYPQTPFPYGELVAENRRRGRLDPEYELVDTGALDGGYWDILVDYAKAGPDDLCIRLRAYNAGPAEATLEVLPTLWFRNTWAWAGGARPRLMEDDGAIAADHRQLGRLVLAGDGEPELLFCDNESNAERLWGVTGTTRYPKDGIGDHVVHGAATVNPDREGTKAALRYRLTVGAGQTAEIRLRLAPQARALGDPWSETLAAREREADEFYEALAPGLDAERALIMRQAFAGMLWSKQFFHYDVARWLDGDRAGPEPPASRRGGRNAGWGHLNNRDIVSMPDKWEYPWYAAWDLAFHCIPLAEVDPAFAKEQLVLLCREWYMHPNGQLPAYEWAFGDVNPPVHAWAALRVFEIAGDDDYEFLERVFHKLLLNFTWWVNRKDASGKNVFEGGFLGLDNISVFDRSAPIPGGGVLEQSDGTAWMAMYCLNLWEIALVLARHDETYEDLATKFFEHFTLIATAAQGQGLWDDEDGFFYDVLNLPEGTRTPLRVRSLVGLIPLCATTTLGPEALERLPGFAAHLRWFLANKPELAATVSSQDLGDDEVYRLLSLAGPNQLRRVLARMLDEAEFLSPHGLRAVSRVHAERPFELTVDGMTARVDYEPGESTSGLFGGNSNWRGPIWFPVNYLLIEALRRFHRYLGSDFRVEHAGRELSLREVADDLSGRLVSIFLDDDAGRRPVFGANERFQRDPAFHDGIFFHEYFHGDTGAGLGASHQTGWTGVVADLILTAARTALPAGAREES